MSKFLDHHARAPQFSSEMIAQLKTSAQTGQTDPYGVRVVNSYFGADGQAWCLTEAPDADAVVSSHAAIGVQMDCDDITEVQSLV